MKIFDSHQSFQIENNIEFKTKMLYWANQFSIFSFLDNCNYQGSNHFDFILAISTNKNIVQIEDIKDDAYYFGHINYEYNFEFYKLKSKDKKLINFDSNLFFKPDILIQKKEKQLDIFCNIENNIETIFNEINHFYFSTNKAKNIIDIKSTITKEKYISDIEKILQHIKLGNCYEINYCQEFYAQNVKLNTVDTFLKLVNISPNPFAALYKVNNNYCICASPEQYLKKDNNNIFSYPIKGTTPRDVKDEIADNEMAIQLYNSQKERSENVMVVDLVRNDMAKICKRNSVTVQELFGIYKYPQVHQMISTIKGDLKKGINFKNIIDATFPMGSMTGAPKQRVMEIINEIEASKRGLFSGAIGFIQPNGNFDFNVVIRSILYNSQSEYLQFFAGSGITTYSNPLKEYEECLWKVAAIKAVLQNAL